MFNKFSLPTTHNQPPALALPRSRAESVSDPHALFEWLFSMLALLVDSGCVASMCSFDRFGLPSSMHRRYLGKSVLMCFSFSSYRSLRAVVVGGAEMNKTSVSCIYVCRY